MPRLEIGAVNFSAQRLPASRRAGREGGHQAGHGVQVLNAFRHHGERDTTSGGVTRITIEKCSTPSGITASGTPDGFDGPLDGVVLNAFRHHGERDLKSTSSPRSVRTSAQRLPASRRAGRDARTVCYLEKEGAQRLPASRRAGLPTDMNVGIAVLRCSTPSSITASGTSTGASSTTSSGAGAQRLPASRRAGHQPADAGQQVEHVPNAFRHHGEWDAAHAAECIDSHRVLNAFRHHGERDFPEIVRKQVSTWCSTPSGITASGTITPRATRPRAGRSAQRLPASRRAGRSGDHRRSPGRRRQVLNAFRHHDEQGCQRWSGHHHDQTVLNAFRHHGERDGRTPKILTTTGAWCSTPSGITASGTRQFDLETLVSDECSTPSGITASGTCGSGWTDARGTGAQRLPASRRAGLGVGGSARDGLAVLNAFRHHGERDSFGRASWRPGHLCSTPSGITASGTYPSQLSF